MNGFKGLSALAGSLLAALLLVQAAPAAASAESAAGSAAARPKVAVTVKATPAKHAGECPVNVTFTAKIKVDRPTKVAYRWLRGDGSKSPVKVVSVKKTKTLKDRATFKGTLKGWQSFEILEPRHVVAKKARFAVSCTAAGDGGDNGNGGDNGEAVPPGDSSAPAPEGSGGQQGGQGTE
ncbi:hypothetical protein FHS43_003574 [Streptosporangium becharense]|uniref:Ig-like domain-containing protein n=1 Tax=Streptosporangium becharense TaxID=1816182 RepID=A0A7W9IEH7_9ACTN|nr:hypothetical protein [Streptosporangium becharense]MBB2912294.1 hypothetical protein [Streptosporangium becharense]MBB5818841.1 hypothetical protein [Streptosporangium becharense]